MSLRERRSQVGVGLVALGLLLLVVLPLIPVQSVLVHDTSPQSFEGPAELESRGVTVIAYGNLSDRGQELYREALQTDGVYRVPAGEGAPEFPYSTPEEREQGKSALVAIERPGDTNLPPSDEPQFDEARAGELPEEEATQRRQRERYDLMETTTGLPPRGSAGQLLRLAAGFLAVLSLGVGGYLFALPEGPRGSD